MLKTPNEDERWLQRYSNSNSNTESCQYAFLSYQAGLSNAGSEHRASIVAACIVIM